MEVINIFFQIFIFKSFKFFSIHGYLLNINKNLKELNIANFLGINFLLQLNIISIIFIL